ncbi:MAG: phosphopantetheine adenylyltransferase [Methanobacteriaceae archaeon]|jgi:pantetheine-phosphate adenylyltransferase|nr:phosphopantetheine adenylyltransferase [Methanobacteriaceae archaeon]
MNNTKYKKLAVGGTFDKFHEGHKKLLDTAFELGEQIEIGVTSDDFGGLKGDIDPCKERISNLKTFFKNKENKFHVMRLDDPYGTTIHEEDFEAIVVSKETEPTAIKINEIRNKKNMHQLDIIVVSFVLADDGTPISSTRIRKGEINKKGHIINSD